MTSLDLTDRIAEINAARQVAHEAQVARDAEAERRRRADPDTDVIVPTVIDLLGSAPDTTWPALGDRFHGATVPLAGGGVLDRLINRLWFTGTETHPRLIAVWSSGASMWHTPAVKLRHSDVSTIDLTLTELVGGRVVLHSSTGTAAQLLDRLDAHADRLGPLTPDVTGDPDALARYVQGPAPIVIPRRLSPAEHLIATTGGPEVAR